MTDELTAEQLEQLLQMVMLPQPPYLMAGVGLMIGVLCGLTFGRQGRTNSMAGSRIVCPCCLGHC